MLNKKGLCKILKSAYKGGSYHHPANGSGCKTCWSLETE